MGYATFRAANQPPQVLGTGVSIGVHVLLFGLFLIGAARAPHTDDTPNAPLAAVTLSFPGAGRPQGGASAAEPRGQRLQELAAPAAPLTRSFTPADRPADVKRLDVAIPMIAVAGATTLPGSAIDINPSSLGPGNAAGGDGNSGSGAGGGAGNGLGPGRDGGLGGEGMEVGNGVTAPLLIREVRPAYTVAAMQAKVQGRVELDVVVLSDGTVDAKRIRIVRSLDAVFGLDGQAIDAVRQWRFRPGTYSNRPVAVRVRVELTFTLR